MQTWCVYVFARPSGHLPTEQVDWKVVAMIQTQAESVCTAEWTSSVMDEHSFTRNTDKYFAALNNIYSSTVLDL